MARSEEQLEAIKVLFKRLYDAHRWTLSHEAIEYPEQYKTLVGAVDGWVDELFDKFNINKQFSMCIYTFGTDYRVCYQMILDKQW